MNIPHWIRSPWTARRDPATSRNPATSTHPRTADLTVDDMAVDDAAEQELDAHLAGLRAEDTRAHQAALEEWEEAANAEAVEAAAEFDAAEERWAARITAGGGDPDERATWAEAVAATDAATTTTGVAASPPAASGPLDGPTGGDPSTPAWHTHPDQWADLHLEPGTYLDGGLIHYTPEHPEYSTSDDYLHDQWDDIQEALHDAEPGHTTDTTDTAYPAADPTEDATEGDRGADQLPVEPSTSPTQLLTAVGETPAPPTDAGTAAWDTRAASVLDRTYDTDRVEISDGITVLDTTQNQADVLADTLSDDGSDVDGQDDGPLPNGTAAAPSPVYDDVFADEDPDPWDAIVYGHLVSERVPDVHEAREAPYTDFLARLDTVDAADLATWAALGTEPVATQLGGDTTDGVEDGHYQGDTATAADPAPAPLTAPLTAEESPCGNLRDQAQGMHMKYVPTHDTLDTLDDVGDCAGSGDLLTLLADDLSADQLLDQTPADAPVPYRVVAPSWMTESRAEAYDDYDAAIPFHVVDAYTHHMNDDTGDTLDQ